MPCVDRDIVGNGPRIYGITVPVPMPPYRLHGLRPFIESRPAASPQNLSVATCSGMFKDRYYKKKKLKRYMYNAIACTNKKQLHKFL